ncbi:MAG TPA: histidine phosphatase family protein [Acidimicrobiales bacterium]
MPGLLLLLRHAQSEWNALGRWQGQADPPLSDEGRRQSVAAAARIEQQPWYSAFDLVASSDLARARETADLIAQSLGLEGSALVDEGLREYDAGEWSGLTLTEIEARWPGEVERFTDGLVPSPPGGEDRRSFDTRIADTVRGLSAFADRAGAESLLVVTHGGVIGSVARSAGLPRLHIRHLAGYRGQHDGRGLSLIEPVDLLEQPELAAESA